MSRPKPTKDQEEKKSKGLISKAGLPARGHHGVSPIAVDPPTPESGSVAQMFTTPRHDRSVTDSLGVPAAALKSRLPTSSPRRPTYSALSSSGRRSDDSRSYPQSMFRKGDLDDPKMKQVRARKKDTAKKSGDASDPTASDAISYTKSSVAGYSIDSKGEQQRKRKRHGSNSLFLQSAIGVTATEVRKRIQDLTRPDETSTSDRYAVRSLMLLILVTGLLAWDMYCIYVSEKMQQTTQDFIVVIMVFHTVGFYLAILSYAYCVQTAGYLFSENGIFSMAILLNHLAVFTMRMFYEIMHLEFRREHYDGYES